MNRKSIGVITLFVLAALGLSAIPAKAMMTQGVDVHGFISQGFLYSDEYNYLAHNSTDGSFEYNEFGINFSKNLSDHLRMGIQLFSRDLGDASNNKVTLDWAYGDYRFKDWLGIRAGRIKLPMGLYNETRDMDMLRTSIILPQGIYDDLLRDNLLALNGAGIYGNVKLGGIGLIEYQALAGVMYADPDSGTRKFYNDSVGVWTAGGFETDGVTKNNTSYAAALRWETPLPGLRLGYSYYKSHPRTQFTAAGGGSVVATIASNTDFHIGSGEFVWNDLTIAAEYMLRKTSTTFLSMEFPFEEESYYLLASYIFTDWFTVGSYYSIQYQDKDDKDGENYSPNHRAWKKDLSLTFRFDINEYWVFKIEGHVVDGTAYVLWVDNPDTDFSESDWYYGAAKVTFSF